MSPLQKTATIAGCALCSWAALIAFGILLGMAVADLGWVLQW